MVIEGIVIENRTETEEQVPFLGDLPLIGGLFRRPSTTDDRTALCFFVTPHILSDEAFADLARISHEKKMEAAQRIGFERVRLVDPDFAATGSGLDLTGFDLPRYAPRPRRETSERELGLAPAEVRARLGRE